MDKRSVSKTASEAKLLEAPPRSPQMRKWTNTTGKSAENWSSRQNMSNKYNIRMIYIYVYKQVITHFFLPNISKPFCESSLNQLQPALVSDISTVQVRCSWGRYPMGLPHSSRRVSCGSQILSYVLSHRWFRSPQFRELPQWTTFQVGNCCRSLIVLLCMIAEKCVFCPKLGIRYTHTI